MYEKEFDKLTAYAKELGYKVKKSENSGPYIAYNYKKINITFEYGDRQAYHLLAHEIGHALQFKSRRHKLYSNWGEFYRYQHHIKRDPYKLVMHEFDAWVRGYKLLRKLGLSTDNFFISSSYFLYTYITRTKAEDLKKTEGWKLCCETIIRLLTIKYKLYLEGIKKEKEVFNVTQ